LLLSPRGAYGTSGWYIDSPNEAICDLAAPPREGEERERQYSDDTDEEPLPAGAVSHVAVIGSRASAAHGLNDCHDQGVLGSRRRVRTTRGRPRPRGRRGRFRRRRSQSAGSKTSRALKRMPVRGHQRRLPSTSENPACSRCLSAPALDRHNDRFDRGDAAEATSGQIHATACGRCHGGLVGHVLAID